MSNTNLKLRSHNRARGFRGLPGTEVKLMGSNEHLVGSDGNINASSKKDMMRIISAMMNAHESGEINDRQETLASIKERHETVAAAFEDRNGGRWTEMGAYLAGELSESADREGFLRRVLKQEEVIQGTVPRIRVRRKNVSAMVATGPGEVQYQIARDQYYYPPEFPISANLRIEDREIYQGTGDIMEDKFIEGQEAIMVAEDRTYISIVAQLLNINNPVQLLVGGLTPSNLAYLRDLITRYNIPAVTALMASNIWTDITGNAAWMEAFDPVSKYELHTTGYLGTLLGLNLITDAYRHPALRVLQSGEIDIIGAMENHGAYTSRGPVQSKETDGYNEGQAARGWYMSEMLSMLVFNPRSVARGIRQ